MSPGSAARSPAASRAVVGNLSVQLEKAPFDALVGWLARLSQQNGVQIESATIDSAGEPGLVDASLVLKSP